QGEGLRHAHHGVVDGGVAVRVVARQDVADGESALLVGGAGTRAALPHRIQDAPLHRLEAIADQREGPADDDAHRVFQVRGAHRLLDANPLYPARIARSSFLSHYSVIFAYSAKNCE